MVREKDYFMSDVRLPPEVKIGCITLRDAQELPLAAVYAAIDSHTVSLTFWGDTPAPWKGSSLVHLGMFRLPEASAEFEREAQRYRESQAKRKTRLPDGVPFEPATLSIPTPEGWEHEGFACTSRNFIHLYRTDGYALLSRWFAPSGTILDHPLLQAIHRNLRLVDGQWIADFPEALPVSRAFVIYDAELDVEASREIREATERARTRLSLGTETEVASTIRAISEALDEIRAGARLPAAKRKQAAIDLGCLWGETLREAKGWEWRAVHPEKDRTAYAVCHPSRSHAVDPLAFIHRILSSKRNANTSELLFNMILADDLPAAPPGTYSWLW